ncbi:hypothetical protein [Methanobacterium oryzae]|uniref:hypothetical protein n=1 Tax=Methanobacterium oryzae TaxID=69540 RepID=UPI003D20B81F
MTFSDPEIYYGKLQELYIEDDEIDISSDFEARATLVKLKRLEKDVLKLRREITTDMRTIRTMYLDESIIEKPKILGLFTLGKKLSHTEKRKKLLHERKRSLMPYEEIITLIDDYIEQIEDLRKYIEREALETYAISEPSKVTKVSKNKE